MSLFRGLDANPNDFFLTLLNPAKPVPLPAGTSGPRVHHQGDPNIGSAFQEENVAAGRNRLSAAAGRRRRNASTWGHYAEAVRAGLIARQTSRLYWQVPIRGPRHERDSELPPRAPPERPSVAPERRLAWAQYDGKGGPVTVIRVLGAAPPPVSTDAGAIALAATLGYLDLRFEGACRRDHPRLVKWLDQFAAAVPSFEATRSQG